jgi:DNA-directed RNA polymerase I and III subunit RPAC1
LFVNFSMVSDVVQVPTVCIEHVYVWDNTSVVVDEVLAHRIGLVPLNVDPALVTMKESAYLIIHIVI